MKVLILVNFDVKEQRMDLFTDGSIIMDYGQVFWPEALV